MTAEKRERSSARTLDRALVRRMAAGDEAAFDSFCTDYIPVVYRFAMRRLDGNQELAREIVQTTICKVIGKLGTFRGKAALTTWLCACCRNEIAAHFRRGGRAVREIELDPEAIATDAGLHSVMPEGPEGGLLRRERAELVHEALDSLPPHYGKVLEWKYLDDLSVKEIARRMNLGPKAAESLLTRARQSFRKGYERLAGRLTRSTPPRRIDHRRMAVEP